MFTQFNQWPGRRKTGRVFAKHKNAFGIVVFLPFLLFFYCQKHFGGGPFKLEGTKTGPKSLGPPGHHPNVGQK